MNFQKITTGTVIQKFNDLGDCFEQQFIAGDNVEYETAEGDNINVGHMPLAGREYFPFDMVQPRQQELDYYVSTCPETGKQFLVQAGVDGNICELTTEIIRGFRK